MLHEDGIMYVKRQPPKERERDEGEAWELIDELYTNTHTHNKKHIYAVKDSNVVSGWQKVMLNERMDQNLPPNHNAYIYICIWMDSPPNNINIYIPNTK